MPASPVVAALVSPQIVWGVIWFALGMLTIAVVVLLTTRWKRAQPLSKCIVLSVWAHVLMAVYASSVNIVFRPPQAGSEIGIRVSDDVGSAAGSSGPLATNSQATEEPWSRFVTQATSKLSPVTLERPKAEAPLAPLAVPKHSLVEAPTPNLDPLAELPRPQHPSAAPQPLPPKLATSRAPAPADVMADPIDMAPPTNTAVTATTVAEPSLQAASTPATTGGSDAAASAAATAAAVAPTVPLAYSLRNAPDRGQIVAEQGGSADTEAAVHAALVWLAQHQSSDGRWDANLLEAGRETKTLGQDRHAAGTEADTGMTGLALLALLASGHTQKSGMYQTNVARGLEFLVRSQAADGSLGGRAEPFAFMYCHAMAGLALSEACGMTGDARWREPIQRAVGYTLMAQNRTTGGWRYRPQDVGDTSQLGWQLMFLKSAGLAGVPMTADCRSGIERYLLSVASGRHGGLAAYRPGHGVSRAMTAEALVCRLFLGQSTTTANSEAAEYLVAQLPGEGEQNSYYWYYATLGLYQLHDSRWRRWNQALAGELVRSQRHDGDAAGSWNPDAVWGGYGGRVYSTALAALCLEVYYRFLPLYVEAAARGRIVK